MVCKICPFLTNHPKNITESKYWHVDICDNQEYLGRSFVTLKRHCPSLSELTSDEWLDLADLIKKLETTFKKAFNATAFNWTCLMNDAFKEKTYSPHVHWHVRPRYEKAVVFAGITFQDPEFGHHYARSTDRIQVIPEEKLMEIIEKIKLSLI